MLERPLDELRSRSDVLFDPGRIIATPGAIAAMAAAETDGIKLLSRHLRGDWGDICKDDAAENDFSVKHGFRVVSAYTLRTGVEVWIITEADRSATTFLLPDEY